MCEPVNVRAGDFKEINKQCEFIVLAAGYPQEVNLLLPSWPVQHTGPMPLGMLPRSWLQNGHFPLHCAAVLATSEPWALTPPIFMGGLQCALVFCFSPFPWLQTPELAELPPGWRDGKDAAVKIAGICLCMQTQLLTWSSMWFAGWSFACVSASSTRADVLCLWLL